MSQTYAYCILSCFTRSDLRPRDQVFGRIERDGQRDQRSATSPAHDEAADHARSARGPVEIEARDRRTKPKLHRDPQPDLESESRRPETCNKRDPAETGAELRICRPAVRPARTTADARLLPPFPQSPALMPVPRSRPPPPRAQVSTAFLAGHQPRRWLQKPDQLALKIVSFRLLRSRA